IPRRSRPPGRQPRHLPPPPPSPSLHLPKLGVPARTPSRASRDPAVCRSPCPPHLPSVAGGGSADGEEGSGGGLLTVTDLRCCGVLHIGGPRGPHPCDRLTDGLRYSNGRVRVVRSCLEHIELLPSSTSAGDSWRIPDLALVLLVLLRAMLRQVSMIVLCLQLVH
ncbi:unnamed protein product, partial [Urochloa humidicola]